MTTYSVLSYCNLDDLTDEVNLKTAEGWRPQGGMAVLPGEVSFIFLQGIVREEKRPAIQAEAETDDFRKSADYPLKS